MEIIIIALRNQEEILQILIKNINNKMTLHPQEIAEIERRNAVDDSRKYRICVFAFNECEDAKDPEIFYRFCNRSGNRCPMRAERIENNNLSN